MWTKVIARQQTGNVGKCAVHDTPKDRGAQILDARSPGRMSFVGLRLSMWVLIVQLDSLHCFDVWNSEVRIFVTVL
jgi:hypothetical protein